MFSPCPFVGLTFRPKNNWAKKKKTRWRLVNLSMSWVHICGFCNYFKSKHDSFCGTAKTAFLTNVWSIFVFSKSSSKNQCLLIQIMWDQFFPVKLPQIVCTNSRNTIKSVEINGKTNCAAQSWHHWVFRKNVIILNEILLQILQRFFREICGKCIPMANIP